MSQRVEYGGLSATDAIAVMERWAQIRARYKDDGIGLADIGHSALLRWMMEGNEPFDEPPPTMMSYPAYELAGGARHKPMEVWFPDDDHPLGDVDTVVIGQSVWNILERKESGAFVVRHRRNGEKSRYLLEPLPDDEQDDRHKWSLVRIEDEGSPDA